MAKFDFGWDEFDPETFTPLTLKQDVERGSALHRADALNLAEALDTLGSYDKGKYGKPPLAPETLFTAIERFQADNGLETDGIIKTDGPTLATINTLLPDALERPRRPAPRPAPAPDEDGPTFQQIFGAARDAGDAPVFSSAPPLRLTANWEAPTTRPAPSRKAARPIAQADRSSLANLVDDSGGMLPQLAQTPPNRPVRPRSPGARPPARPSRPLSPCEASGLSKCSNADREWRGPDRPPGATGPDWCPINAHIIGARAVWDTLRRINMPSNVRDSIMMYIEGEGGLQHDRRNETTYAGITRSTLIAEERFTGISPPPERRRPPLTVGQVAQFYHRHIEEAFEPLGGIDVLGRVPDRALVATMISMAGRSGKTAARVAIRQALGEIRGIASQDARLAGIDWDAVSNTREMNSGTLDVVRRLVEAGYGPRLRALMLDRFRGRVARSGGRMHDDKRADWLASCAGSPIWPDNHP